MNRILFFLKNNIKFRAFSMIEVMTALIILGIITAATVPIITRKYTNKSYTVTESSANKGYGKKCSSINDDCLYCKMGDNDEPLECLICNKKCESHKDVKKCQCISCDDLTKGGISNCEACTTDDNDNIICTKCKIDYYLDNNTCKLCTNDNNSDGNICDGAIKSPCPPGTFGYYNDDPNADPNEAKYMCMFVSGGYYQNEYGKVAENNIICPAGSYCCGAGENCVGATEPSQCEAGKYSNAGQSACTACEAGYYSATGATSCTRFTGRNCQAFDPAGGACTDCNQGYHLSGGMCETCESGYYMTDSTNKVCSPCEEDTYTAEGNTATSCSVTPVEISDDEGGESESGDDPGEGDDPIDDDGDDYDDGDDGGADDDGGE